MNTLDIWEKGEFSKIRIFDINGEAWFVGKDICEYFNDKNHNRTLSRVDDCDKKIIQLKDRMGRNQKAIAVNESGMYSILFGMQPQKANNGGWSNAYPIEVQERIEKLARFKHWVTSEVLPSIRKHGMYAVDELVNNPELLIKVATELKEEREKNKRLEADNERMKPKGIFADAVATSRQSILIGQLAKLICQNGHEIGQQRLFRWMRENGYLMKHGSNYNMPMQRYVEQGLFEIKESSVTNPDGSVRLTRTTKVTGKGQQYFINKFLAKEGGI